MVPGTGRNIRADVRVEPGVLDTAVSEVVVEPRAVAELCIDDPIVRTERLVVEATDRESHCRFHVVPGIAVAAFEPWDHPIGSLHGSDGRSSREQLLFGEDSGNFRQICTCPDHIDHTSTATRSTGSLVR